MAQRLHSSDTLVDGMNSVQFNKGDGGAALERKRVLDEQIKAGLLRSVHAISSGEPSSDGFPAAEDVQPSLGSEAARRSSGPLASTV